MCTLFVCIVLISLIFGASFQVKAEDLIPDAANRQTEPMNLEIKQVRIPNFQPGTSQLYHYITTLLNLTLAQTEGQFGLVRLAPGNKVTSQHQQFQDLNDGRLDVTWSITSAARENDFIPVRIPLMGGLFGYRVLLVKKNNPEFYHAPALARLKELVAVQGNDWPDSEILQSNQFTVKTSQYESLFILLKQGHADYFPRAAHEIFEELESSFAKGLNVAPGIAIKYDNPMIFFVSRNHPELARRIKVGLTILSRNGDMQRLLTSQHFYIRARNLLENRTIYTLNNPLLTTATQQAMTDYHSPLHLIDSIIVNSEINEPAVQAQVGKQLVLPESDY